MKKFNLKVAGNLKIFGSIALAILIAGVVCLFTIGMNIGLDFAGGAKINIAFGEGINKTEAENKVSNLFDKNEKLVDIFEYDGTTRWSYNDEEGDVLEIGIAYTYKGKDIKTTSEQKDFSYKVGASVNDTGEDIETLIEIIYDGLSVDYTSMESEDVTCHMVSGDTSKDILNKALIALAVAVVAILIYIIIRFTFASGLAAIVALCHDVLIMIAFTIFFQIQVNTTFIAAVITIVGYSINATIVIFDRIRELKKMDSLKELSDKDIANKAVSDTFSRSILTTITTLVAIVVLAVVCAIMGISSMAEFALPIVFGLVAGFYSSVFLSSSIWAIFRKWGLK